MDVPTTFHADGRRTRKIVGAETPRQLFFFDVFFVSTIAFYFCVSLPLQGAIRPNGGSSKSLPET